ncbi:MAG: sigma 54-dependent Fis family transcriptional regulator [Myxococcales bacterium]|nr:sigma 54-dependent Fis family transcriptional regulator [Myxococcales bacterium]
MTSSRLREGPTVVVHASPRPRPLAARIRVEGASSQPESLLLAEERRIVGAGSEADLVVDDATVSRRHIALELVPEGVKVSDLGSRNGTFFAGQRIEAATIALGNTITLGTVRVRLDVDAAELDGRAGSDDCYDALLGRSEAMRRLIALLGRLEGSLATVLVEGETGTGKELVARAIHRRSNLARQPLVAVNCAAFDRETVRSDLFGHKKGAFTGAVESRKGAFELADGGTLFLDEVSELPGDVQPVLLRALETGEVTRMGETVPIRVKVRVVAASNRDLQVAVQKGQFREDLFYRLAVVRLQLPPLRERGDDILLLARHFAVEAGIGELSADVEQALRAHSWPGNARELKNAVHAYAAIGVLPPPLSSGGRAIGGVLGAGIDLELPYASQKDEVVQAFTLRYLERLLEHTHGNQSEAARISGIERSHLNKLIAKLGLKRS